MRNYYKRSKREVIEDVICAVFPYILGASICLFLVWFSIIQTIG